jgi:hypothetical protein
MPSHHADGTPEPGPASSGAAATPSSDSRTSQDLPAFDIDLTFEEARRRAEVIAAWGDDWDPAEIMRGEEEAYARLYAGLDAEQQRIYDDLAAAGVLPGRETGRAAD